MNRRKKGQIVVVTGLLIGLAWILKYFQLTFYSTTLMIIASVIAGYPIAKSAIQALRFRVLGIEALVTIAVIGAFIIQEYWEAAAVTFLFILGSYLETRTLEKTRSSLKALFDLTPKKATVIRDHQEVEVMPEDVKKGEIILVRPGEKIPVDGTVIKGKATVNQAAITGESIPVSKEMDSSVFSSTVIEYGYLEVRAEKVGEDTTFSRILEMVEEAQENKATTQKFLERFSSYYTPGILLIAIIVYLFTRDLSLSLTFLVIACPGALIISAPVSIVAGIGNGAKNGILIKGGEYLEKAGKIDVVAFDKTGTLTVGKPKVTSIQSFRLSEDEFLKIVARAEVQSEHHLARAIMEEAKSRKINVIHPAEDFTGLPGRGIKAIVNNQVLYVGNRKLLNENNIHIPNKVESYLQHEESQGHTAILAADEKGLLGVVSIADVLREEAFDLVNQLKKSGVKEVIMLTGDNKRTAQAIADQLGIVELKADLLPEDKVLVLKQLKKEWNVVAMVGDGINDAPSLATADLGIAMGQTGTDVAMETSDIVLMSDQLHKLPYALGLSRATVKNMKQNIYFSVFVVAILLVGVLTKKVFLAAGMFVHELSVLLVIFNAIRLLKYSGVKGMEREVKQKKEAGIVELSS